MKKTLLFALPFLAFSAFAQTDFKQVASDMSVMTRSMDRLMAKQEMKDSMALTTLHMALQQPRLFAGSPASQKVAMLTDDQSLKDCQSSYHEDRSPDGQTVDALVNYNGPQCPITISATIHMRVENGVGGGDVNLQINIVSEKLQAEMDMTQFNMPMKIKLQAAPSDTGFAMKVEMAIAAQAQSQKYGSVQYDANFGTEMIFGQEMKMNANTTENYSVGSQKVSFVQTAESGSSGQKESYSINGAEVSKEVFEKQHGAVSLPGFVDKATPLEKSHSCKLQAYDAQKYPLDQIRKSIKDNTVDSLPVADRLSPMVLTATGKVQSPIQLGGQQLFLQVDVTADAARFSFSKSDNGQAGEEIGRLTAVLGDRVDLTRQINNRIVRITCEPK